MRFVTWLAAATLSACAADIAGSGPLDPASSDDGTPRDPVSPETHLPADDASSPERCPEDTRFVYLLGWTGFGETEAVQESLYRFDPDEATVSLVGEVDCGEILYVGWFAVDRHGNGWMAVLPSADAPWELRSYDLSTGECAASGVALRPPPAPTGAWQGVASMAFVSSAGSSEETLYVSLYDDWLMPHLHRVELPAGAMEELDQFYGPLDEFPFITGSGEGQLFALNAFGAMSNDEGSISRVDLTDGHTSPLVDLGPFVSDLWRSDDGAGRYVSAGFVVWGDGFYVVISRADRVTSTAFKIHPSGEYEVVLEDVGFLALAGAVSTCAPVELF